MSLPQVNVMTQVNNIFLSSEFLNDYPAYGFEIKEIVVHTAPTNIDGHYNVNRDNWGTSELLTVIAITPQSEIALILTFNKLRL